MEFDFPQFPSDSILFQLFFTKIVYISLANSMHNNVISSQHEKMFLKLLTCFSFLPFWWQNFILVSTGRLFFVYSLLDWEVGKGWRLGNSRKEKEEHKDSIRLGIRKKYRYNIKGFEIKNRMTLRPCFCFEKRLSRIIFLHLRHRWTDLEDSAHRVNFSCGEDSPSPVSSEPGDLLMSICQKRRKQDSLTDNCEKVSRKKWGSLNVTLLFRFAPLISWSRRGTFY